MIFEVPDEGCLHTQSNFHQIQTTITEIKNTALTIKNIPATPGDQVSAFAHSFNGYEYGGSFKACADIAAKVKRCMENNDTDALTLSELRTGLFFYYRAARHSGAMPDEKRVAQFIDLIRARVAQRRFE